MINELVKRLSEGKHEVIIGYRGEDYEEIKQRIKDGFIYIKFTQTKGGTELGINVDYKLTCLKDANFELGKGHFQIVGICELDFQRVRCVADINLATRHGIGYLELLGK